MQYIPQGVLPPSLHNLTFEQLQINKWASGLVFNIQRCWLLRHKKYHILRENLFGGEDKKILHIIEWNLIFKAAYR